MASVEVGGKTWLYDERRPIGDVSGMGKVYRATDGVSECALKIIHRDPGDVAGVRRSDREIEIGETLIEYAKVAPDDLTNVLIPIDQQRTAESLLIVMPLAAHSLRSAIKNGHSEPLGREATIAIANGLQQLARVGVLHRDLKPENVLRVGSEWKLADFGISRHEAKQTATYTFQGWGTAPYLAPEIWLRQPATQRSDLYALGMIAYETVTGQLPWDMDSADDVGLLHINEPVPSLDMSDRVLARIILSLLSKSPVSRLSAERVQKALRLSATGFTVQQRQLADLAGALKPASTLVDEDAISMSNQFGSGHDDTEDLVFAELEAIVYQASEIIAPAVPDSFLEGDRNEWQLQCGFVELRITMMVKSTSIDPAIINAYSLYDAESDPAVLENFVCQRADEGGFTWIAIRFDDGSGKLSGLSRRDLEVHFQALRRGIPSTWEEYRLPLTPEHIVDTVASMTRHHGENAK